MFVSYLHTHRGRVSRVNVQQIYVSFLFLVHFPPVVVACVLDIVADICTPIIPGPRLNSTEYIPCLQFIAEYISGLPGTLCYTLYHSCTLQHFLAHFNTWSCKDIAIEDYMQCLFIFDMFLGPGEGSAIQEEFTIHEVRHYTVQRW